MPDIFRGLIIPFIGTTAGAAMVFLLRDQLTQKVQKSLTGFAAGVMVAASFWSLLAPALEEAENMGKFAFVPAAVGFLIGMGFLLLLDVITPHMHMDNEEEGPKSGLKRTTKLILAVTLHNIPEGMAVGVVFAGWLYGTSNITMASALALSIGIAIQNFPEGAIVSMPLRAGGMKKSKTFVLGTLSGAVEPVAGLITVLAAGFVVPVLPYLLSFAAGAMMYVVVEELIPEMSEGKHSNLGTVAFAAGFGRLYADDDSGCGAGMSKCPADSFLLSAGHLTVVMDLEPGASFLLPRGVCFSADPQSARVRFPPRGVSACLPSGPR